MKLFSYDKDIMVYKTFKFWRFKPLFLIFLFSIFSGITSILLFYNYYETEREKKLKKDISYLIDEYDKIHKRVIESEIMLEQIKENDSIIYRSIFETEDLAKNKFAVYYEGEGINRYNKLVDSVNQQISVLFDQLERQKYSMNQLIKDAKNKEEILSHIPAIQPIDNKDLKRTASGWGWRIHPIYHIKKFHYGFDFSAKIGTNIYSTGDGKIESIVLEKSSKGYGNMIIINHSYGYKTLYAHLSKINVKEGQVVKRGEIIGQVGNTGMSTGPHLHYEVIRNGKKENPVFYFFNDLNPEEYNEIIRISNNIHKSYD